MTTNESESKMILYVDDEEQALKYFDKVFGKHFHTVTAKSTDEAIALLKTKADQIGVLMTDQRMPKRLGLDLLMHVRDQYPHIVRILTTAYAELDNAIDAVNKGEIYRYITKPWNIPDLKATLQQALDYQPAPVECTHVIRPYAILAAGLAGRFRGCKKAITKLIEHWPTPSAISPTDDTHLFVKLADTLNQAGPAMDDDMSLEQLQQQIQNIPDFAGKVSTTSSDRFQVNSRMAQATLDALNRIAMVHGIDKPAVNLNAEVRDKIQGVVISWQILPHSNDAMIVNWSADLLLVYLFAMHHGGQITVANKQMILWLASNPRDVNVPKDMDNWLANIL
jgi:CheY-like chemotaxis protein